MTFGEYIKSVREDKGLSLREVARRSDVSHPYLSQLETGKNKNPTHEILNKLSKGLSVDYMSLLVKAGYIDAARMAAKTNIKSEEQINRINEDGTVINPESFPQPTTISRTLNVPIEFKLDGKTKDFENSDILNPYNYFSLALDKNNLFPLINREGEQISKDDLKKILSIIDTILK